MVDKTLTITLLVLFITFVVLVVLLFVDRGPCMKVGEADFTMHTRMGIMHSTYPVYQCNH